MRNNLLTAALFSLTLGALSAPAFAIDIPVQSGGFESTPPNTGSFGFISGWSNVTAPNPGPGNMIGAFNTYAGFTASEGSRMALLSNQGLGNVTMRSVTPTQIFTMYYLEFRYIYLTTDPANTSLANRDTFRVKIEYYDQGLTALGSQSYDIDTGNLTSTGIDPGNPFNGTVSAGAGIGGTSSALGISFVSMNLPPTAYYAQFEFTMLWNGTSGVSGVLLDNVIINPEPGTMALFGLGAAGLGAMAWRRRKARNADRKKSAPTA